MGHFLIEHRGELLLVRGCPETTGAPFRENQQSARPC